ncbi:hypothetical protein CEXT_483401 [Caerostris extrusa]|uniref:Secreted protein n=1 Tax=Caerostris extrusa TaxID=172846 RepID=A0AAV4NR49_CAEEX|nr:hypothetical protein CEXT_483401 [Caerostris extrusa]
MWNASRFCVSSLRRGHANLLCIVPILVYVLPKRVQGSLTEPRRKPNHDDVIWGFFLSVKLADLGTFTVSAAIDDRTPKPRLGDGRNSI